jgi:hypothetical protein
LDGTYNLKVVASTAKSQKELSKQVVVNNELLKLDFAENLTIGLTDIIVTDSAGGILNNIKFPFYGKKILYPKSFYNGKTIHIINVFDFGQFSAIKCDLYIKRGSTWKTTSEVNNKGSFKEADLRFKNFPSFENIAYGTAFGYDYHSLKTLSDTTNAYKRKYYYAINSKLFVQLERNNKAYHHFFDIAPNSNLISADLAQVTKESKSRSISVPGESGNLWIRGKLKDSPFYYRLTTKAFSGTTTKYFYPDDMIDQYLSHITFLKNGWSYSFLYNDILPETVEPMDIKANWQNSTIKNINCKVEGKYDYYTLAYYARDNSLLTYFGVTSTRDIGSFKFPDISKITNVKSSDIEKLVLDYCYVYQLKTFNSKLLPFDHQIDSYNAATYPFKVAVWYNPERGPTILY